MTNSSNSNGSPIEDAARSIYKAWGKKSAFPGVSSYKALIESLDPEADVPSKEDETDNPSREELERALIHSEDWAHWSDKQRKIAARYANGHTKPLKEKSLLFPNVPQPFMGDLSNPKVVVVTFNPGFHEFVDWVLGGPYKSVDALWSTVEKVAKGEKSAKNKLLMFFSRMGYISDNDIDLEAINAQCVRAKRSWITEQDKLLSAIRGGNHYPFVPWKKNAETADDITTCDFLLPSPLNLHGAHALPWVRGNWHCDYFANSADNPNHLRNYVQSNSGSNRSDGIAQLELFPYQSPKGSDVEKLAPNALKQLEKDPTPWTTPEDHLIPSQMSTFNYLVAALSQVRSQIDSKASERTLVIVRGSAAKTAMFRQAVLKAGGDNVSDLKKSVYQLSGQNSSLTLKNLKSLDGNEVIKAGNPSEEDYQKAANELLGSNAVQLNGKAS